ncbi:MAG: SMP-30/gluconolactonase/LRE family protein [Rubrivivax sp.]|nr:SMP-30/gluconolactonase/LRE family protein [Rubrivivax sp.]
MTLAADTTTVIDCIVQGADILGETPRWCERTGTLWWIDVRRPALQSWDAASGRHTALRLHPDLVTGAIALREAGGFLLATAAGLCLFDPASDAAPQVLAHPEAGKPGMRLNDGRCDRRGRFWVGSMHDTQRNPVGTLYRLDADHRCQAMLDGFVLPNSICWSPDDRTLYFSDTHNQMVWAFDYDIDEGRIGARRVFADWTHQIGRPDGATVDVDGCLWTCMVASGQLIRQTPRGKVDRVIQLPVTNPTCPAFGGSRLDTLFITSHSQRLSLEQHAREPLAGALLALDPGIQGLPEARYRG